MFTGLDTKVLAITEVLPQEDSVVLVVKVKNPKVWGHILKDVLRFNEDEMDFGTSISKEYYIKEGKFLFAWKVVVWGDLDEAEEMVSEVMAREPELKVAKRPPPPATVASLSNIRREVISRGDHREIRHHVPLPHRAGKDRNSELEGTRKIGGKGRGAYASGIGESE